MALRYQSGKINMASVGGAGALTHGLGYTPDEFNIVNYSAASFVIPIAASAPDNTYIYITGIGVEGNASVQVFASINHSIMK